MVGRGEIRRSDILYSIPSDKRKGILYVRKTIPLHSVEPDELVAVLKDSEYASLWSSEELMLGDANIVLDYWKKTGVALGDLYEELRTIETALHGYVKRRLESEFAEGSKAGSADGHNDAWWTRCVPDQVKADCNERWEKNSRKGHSYEYTDFIHLWKIIDKNWAVFSSPFSAVYPGGRKNLVEMDLDKVNDIRNKVMHAVRGIDPTDEDFELVRKVRQRIMALPSLAVQS
jgi:hypothetical protein